MDTNLVTKLKFMGLKKYLIYFLFQRILRVNSNVPWPVHHSSIVLYPNNIKRSTWRPFPGYMPGSYIQAINGIVIGGNVRLGPGVKIISANHNLYNYDVHDSKKPIIIGNNCWIGANSVILPGIELGEHVIVGAGSVVTKSFESNCVIAGNPAKKIRDIGIYGGQMN